MVSLIHECLRLRSRDSEALDCALLYAVFYGRVTCAASLLAEEANVNSRSHGETALHYAAYKGNAAIAELLLGTCFQRLSCLSKHLLRASEHDKVAICSKGMF